MKRSFRTSITVAGIIMFALAMVFILGPRTPVDTTVRFDSATLDRDIDAYLARTEARFEDIREGNEKQIVWAGAPGVSTPLSVIYIHGFSASAGEVRPLPDRIAAALGANLFYTRLTGHGRDGTAMAEASVNDWIDDATEAIAIGRRIGQRVVVMGTSTGATLATWALTEPHLVDGIAAAVFLSPNYGLQAAGSQILTMPWGRRIARAILGPERGFEPRNALHARFWTTRYPTRALMPMAALVDLATESNVEGITVPTIFVYSDSDGVVSPAATDKIVQRWGAPTRRIEVEASGDPLNHVIAGDALSPQTTDELAGAIIDALSNYVDTAGLASLEKR